MIRLCGLSRDNLMVQGGNHGDDLEEVCSLLQVHLLPLWQVAEHIPGHTKALEKVIVRKVVLPLSKGEGRRRQCVSSWTTTVLEIWCLPQVLSC